MLRTLQSSSSLLRAPEPMTVSIKEATASSSCGPKRVITTFRQDNASCLRSSSELGEEIIVAIAGVMRMIATRASLLALLSVEVRNLRVAITEL